MNQHRPQTSFAVLMVAFLAATPSVAFITTCTKASSLSFPASFSASTCLYSSSTEESEVERLVRKARELREQAQQDEQAMHQQLTTKKVQQKQKWDSLIDYFLFGGDVVVDTTNKVVDRMRTKQVSMETLEHLVDRLDDRHAIASGYEHVTGAETFQRTKQTKNEAEMKRLDAMIDRLLAAVQVLDDEFQQSHKKKTMGGVAGESSGSLIYSVSHAESSHWGGGNAAQQLKQRLQEKRREREEQFLKRQEEFHEAQRVKKNKPPPPKVGDDHGFLR